MLKAIKNIRKLNNTKLLVISSDDGYEKEINGDFKDFKQAKTLKDGLELAVSSQFDIVVIDTDLKDVTFYETCSEISSIAPNLPKIIISGTAKEEDIVTSINVGAYTVLSKPLRAVDLKLAIIMCLNQTKRGDKIEFDQGIYFDEYRDQFFRAGGVLIDFTRLEKSFLKLLIAKKNEVIDYDTIKEVVWKGKDMSIYTMRNIVNKIRQKTYYEIIKNQSNRGYTIDIVKGN
ncbi:signal transduction response regulator, OmpR family [Aliarcobacter faecis]|uniref:response regulator transcription factor n=1 Tax=Aliarcobacter faecis TaxID=1564138 RepID=UPI00047ED520|nr:response regulator [Aliarcobacter faecis]QKF73415.1 signal transduction response regulator, OmpR family [Aliarcobacter faecis]